MSDKLKVIALELKAVIVKHRAKPETSIFATFCLLDILLTALIQAGGRNEAVEIMKAGVKGIDETFEEYPEGV